MSRPYDFSTQIPRMMGPLDRHQNALAIQGQEQTQQLNALAIRAQQGDLEARNALATALQGQYETPEARSNALMSADPFAATDILGAEQDRELRESQMGLQRDQLGLQREQFGLDQEASVRQGREALSKRMLEAIQVARARPRDTRLSVFRTYLADTPMADLFDEDTETTDEALDAALTQLLGPIEVTAGASLMSPGGGLMGTAPGGAAGSGELVRGSGDLANFYRVYEKNLVDQIARAEGRPRELTAQERSDVMSLARSDAREQAWNTSGLVPVYDAARDISVLTPRAPGLELPSEPTAGMRERESARAEMLPKMDALQAAAGEIITRIGPEQRLNATARGVAAVFGSDPDFRTYQDAKAAYGMQLAVANQGAAQLSDRDVQIWANLVPDPYRDTASSMDMKFSLLRVMASMPLQEHLLTTAEGEEYVRNLLRNMGAGGSGPGGAPASADTGEGLGFTPDQ
jgi:hypothetical protein